MIKIEVIIHFKSFFMRHLSIAIFIGLLIFLPSCKYFKNGGLFGRKARTAAIMKAREDSIRVADSLQKIHDRITAMENARLDSIRNADAERLAQESKYNIIVGSFITPAYAAAMADEYRKEGYDPKILKMEGSRFELVSAESHDNFRQAFARLKQFQDTVQFEAWLYIKK